MQGYGVNMKLLTGIAQVGRLKADQSSGSESLSNDTRLVRVALSRLAIPRRHGAADPS